MGGANVVQTLEGFVDVVGGDPVAHLAHDSCDLQCR